MDKILINDILNFRNDELSNVKIKFNIHNGYSDPLELYKQNPDKVNVGWFLWHEKRRYFQEGQIAICFLRLATDTWLLTTIKRITKLLDVPVNGGIGYEAIEEERYKRFFGRIIVKYHNKDISMGRRYETLMGELEVLEVLNDCFTGNDFPGY